MITPKTPRKDYTAKYLKRIRCLSVYLCLVFTALFISTGLLQANPDVYAVLPADTRVVQYGMGDLDGDIKEELAVLYTSGDMTNLALFKAESGRWSLWWTDNTLLSTSDGATPSSVELVDVNGDGKSEILFYYLTRGGRGMVSRILSLGTEDPAHPSADILLEDTTEPPGYPLFGSEDGVPSITFLRMPLIKGGIGYRRVYCWDGKRFEKCLEVPWEKP